MFFKKLIYKILVPFLGHPETTWDNLPDVIHGLVVRNVDSREFKAGVDVYAALAKFADAQGMPAPDGHQNHQSLGANIIQHISSGDREHAAGVSMHLQAIGGFMQQKSIKVPEDSL